MQVQNGQKQGSRVQQQRSKITRNTANKTHEVTGRTGKQRAAGAHTLIHTRKGRLTRHR